MKKTLLTLALMVLGLCVYAQESKTLTLTFNGTETKAYGMDRISDNNGPYLSDGFTLADTDPVSIVLNKKSGSNGYRLWNDGIRFFKNSDATMTISIPESVGVITKIEWTVVSGCTFKVDGATTNSTSPWSGSSNSVVFAYSATQNKALKTLSITYTLTGNPNLQPAGLSFGDESEYVVPFSKKDEFVAPKLTKETSANPTYSSSDNTVATVDKTTGDVTILSVGTTKITAKCDETATHYGGSASYTIMVVGSVDNIAKFLADKSTQPVIVTGDVEVIYQNGAYLYVQDNSGRLLIYGSVGQKYTSGDIIPGGFQGIFGEYGKEPQMASPSGFEPATGHNDFTPREVKLSEITEADLLDYVVVNDVTISSISGKNVNLTQGETTYKGYNQYNLTLPTDFADKTYNIKGIVGRYNGNMQLLIASLEEVDKTTGIADIVADDANAPVEYFNLQGIRVENPESGLYIRRQGNKVSKVLVK